MCAPIQKEHQLITDEARVCASEVRALPEAGHLGMLRRLMQRNLKDERLEEALRQLTALKRRFDALTGELEDAETRAFRFHFSQLLEHIGRIACRFGNGCSSDEQREAEFRFKREFQTYCP